MTTVVVTQSSSDELCTYSLRMASRFHTIDLTLSCILRVFLSDKSIIAKTTASIPTKFMLNDKDQQVHIMGCKSGQSLSLLCLYCNVFYMLIHHLWPASTTTLAVQPLLVCIHPLFGQVSYCTFSCGLSGLLKSCWVVISDKFLHTGALLNSKQKKTLRGLHSYLINWCLKEEMSLP